MALFWDHQVWTPGQTIVKDRVGLSQTCFLVALTVVFVENRLGEIERKIDSFLSGGEAQD